VLKKLKQLQQNPDFCILIFCDFTHFLYGTSQMPVQTTFFGSYTIFRLSSQKCKILVVLYTHFIQNGA